MCFNIHREVAKAFLPNPENFPTVNHKDGNKHNNCADNLEWMSMKDQMEHAVKNKLMNYSPERNKKIAQSRQGTIRISKDGKRSYAKLEDLQSYLSNGWSCGWA